MMRYCLWRIENNKQSPKLNNHGGKLESNNNTHPQTFKSGFMEYPGCFRYFTTATHTDMSHWEHCYHFGMNKRLTNRVF